MIRWALPVEDVRTSKLDDATDRGFDPGEDYGSQPTGPISLRIAQWAHQGSVEGCQDCGRRCDYCQDRTCTKWGPAPETTCGAHFVCEDCATDNHCRECQQAREKEAS